MRYSAPHSVSSRGFVLLEVLVALAILGIALSMLLQSFTTSMKAAQASEKTTMGCIIARHLLDGWEITPPKPGESSDECGEMFPNYYYNVLYDNETQPEYDDVSRLKDGRLAVLRSISLSVYYKRPSEEGSGKRVLHIETALSASERFSSSARRDNRVRFDR